MDGSRVWRCLYGNPRGMLDYLHFWPRSQAVLLLFGLGRVVFRCARVSYKFGGK